MSEDNKQTYGVKTLVGDPKKAIKKLALPMILAMSVQTIYNLVDAFWVSGLGANALAAVGLFFPFFFMMLALATGLGVGGGAAISRRIGAQDKDGASNVATHTMIFMVIISLALTLPLLLLAEPMFIAIGAGDTLADTLAYSNVLFGGAIIIFFANVSNALLRGEGDAKRAMYAMVLGGIINIILDPILIYGLDMGIAGAAWATLISLGISAALLFYWLFMKKDTYVDIAIRKFKYSKEITKDIFKVGLPASVQQLSMSINMLILNIIIISVAGTDGVAVITTGWRIATLGILPLMGIATAVVSVCGATYGMGNYQKMDTALKYSIKIGLMIEIVVAVLIFVFASQLAAIFTQSESAAHLAPDITRFFQISWLFLPGVAHGMLAGAMFQGAGKGMNALVLTLFRTVMLTPVLAWGLAVQFGMGLDGIWWGLVVANVVGSIVSYSWARIYINNLKRQNRGYDTVRERPSS
ncbi:MAG: MATE family efflux transporter [Thermoplasmata archaeon]|nr:MATE family efflux transporter [Thermoplasmata archaeon]